MLFKSVLTVLKNATIIIPVLEGMVFTIWDFVKPTKKIEEKKVEDVEVVSEADLDRNLGYK